MKDNITLICSILAVAIAVIAPIVTALINNIFQLKIEKQNFNQSKKLEAIEKFLKASSDSMYDYVHMDFRSSAAKIYLYLPKKYWKDLDEFIFLVHTRSDEAKNKYFQIAKILSDLLNYR